MRALFVPIALALACAPTRTPSTPSSAPDADGDGFPADIDCDDANPDIVPDEQGSCVLGLDCADILAQYPSAQDGVYWIDPDGPELAEAPFATRCDMAGGGFTEITGELLTERPWTTFERVAGIGDAQVGWIELGRFLLDPTSADGCSTVAVRATVLLPWKFSAWYGSWVGAGLDQDSQHDDKHTDTAWGEVTDDCRGHLKFGTDHDTLKVGGEWGLHWNAAQFGPREFVWDMARTQPTHTLRWELADQGGSEDAVIEDISIWVR